MQHDQFNKKGFKRCIYACLSLFILSKVSKTGLY